MIQKCTSLQIADKVIVAILKHKLSRTLDGLIELYKNGTEQGYLIWQPSIDNQAFYITQYRNSTYIAVYQDQYNTLTFSDNAYKGAKYFRYSDYSKVVNYILEKMLARQILHNLGE